MNCRALRVGLSDALRSENADVGHARSTAVSVGTKRRKRAFAKLPLAAQGGALSAMHDARCVTRNRVHLTARIGCNARGIGTQRRANRAAQPARASHRSAQNSGEGVKPRPITRLSATCLRLAFPSDEQSTILDVRAKSPAWRQGRLDPGSERPGYSPL
jgi:hypothetical protein